MKKVISIALFGEKHEAYAQYLPSFVLAHLNIFPIEQGWRLRVHVDNAVNESRWGRLLSRLQSRGALDVTHMQEPAVLTRAMLWRMAPVFHTDAGYVFCRDLDALPMPRDRACCEMFMKSGKTVHTIHDNVMHIAIMGGLCGFHAPDFRASMGINTFDELLFAAQQMRPVWEKHGTDQDVLNALILRPGGPTLLEHRFAGWHAGPKTQPAREPGRYLCPAWSTPVPDHGVPVTVSAEADRLANHLGAAGYEAAHARHFWEGNGKLAFSRLLRDCEEGL